MYLFQVHKLRDSKLEGHDENPSLCKLGVFVFISFVSFLMFYV